MMDDKFLKDAISNDEIDIPDSLKPENIGGLLDKAKAEKKSRLRKRIVSTCFSVAGLAAAVVIGLLVFRPGFLADTGNGQTEKTAGVYRDSADKPKVSYEDIYKRLGKNQTRDFFGELLDSLGLTYGYKYTVEDSATWAAGDMVSVPEMAVDGVVNEAGGAQSGTGDILYSDSNATSDVAASEEKDFSSTNTQEELVDEGDIIKTDGEYFYILNQNYLTDNCGKTVSIVKVDGDSLSKVAVLPEFSLGDEYYSEIYEMYVDGNRLILAGTAYLSYDYYWSDSYDYDSTMDYDLTFAVTYDISDKSNPVLLGTVKQSGSYESSRKVGDYVYLMSRFGVYHGAINKKNYSAYIPEICDDLIAAEDIYCPASPYMGYTVIAAVDINDPNVYTSSEAVMLNPSDMYVSPNAIYFKGNGNIVKYGYENGQLFYIAEAEVPGVTDSQFSFNEYNGYLRIVTTKSEYVETKGEPDDKGNAVVSVEFVRSNGLYIFDSEMNMVGYVDNLAEGEQIKSSRFIGDMAYFVTFRNTDPLFAVDVSDPANPVILSELKVTGFSEYLHPYGNGRMLGVGYEADPDTGRVDCLKLSMFDVSDSSNVYEASRFLIEESYSAPCMYNHKAILVDSTRNLIGFASDGFGFDDSNALFNYGNYYRLFKYDETNGFEILLQCSVGELYGVRGIYIDDYFYIVDAGDEKIHVIDLNSYECVKVWSFE